MLDLLEKARCTDRASSGRSSVSFSHHILRAYEKMAVELYAALHTGGKGVDPPPHSRGLHVHKRIGKVYFQKNTDDHQWVDYAAFHDAKEQGR